MTETPASYDAIIPDRLYIGNLSAALDSSLLEHLQITNILSVCYDSPKTSYPHAVISLEDSEYSDILIHLPEAVAFIESALENEAGRVFVHCRMGISRSVTVVCAYLMKTRGVSAINALRLVQHARPCAHPNYGFIKQLAVYEACSFEPSEKHPVYRSWKRRHRQDALGFLNLVQDTTEVIPGSVFLSSELPDDPIRIECLLVELGITHVVSLAPASSLTYSDTCLSLPEKITHFNIPLPKPLPTQLVTASSPLLRALPTTCKLIENAVKDGAKILIYSDIESRACAVFCAYLIQAKGMSADEALATLRSVLPLFDPTKSFVKTLQLFDALLASEVESRVSSRTGSFSSSELHSGSSLLPLSSLSSPPPSPPSSCASSVFNCPSPPPPCTRAVALTPNSGQVEDSDGEEDVKRLTKRAAKILGGTKMAIHVDAFSEVLMKLGVRDEANTKRSTK